MVHRRTGFGGLVGSGVEQVHPMGDDFRLNGSTVGARSTGAAQLNSHSPRVRARRPRGPERSTHRSFFIRTLRTRERLPVTPGVFGGRRCRAPLAVRPSWVTVLSSRCRCSCCSRHCSRHYRWQPRIHRATRARVRRLRPSPRLPRSRHRIRRPSRRRSLLRSFRLRRPIPLRIRLRSHPPSPRLIRRPSRRPRRQTRLPSRPLLRRPSRRPQPARRRSRATLRTTRRAASSR